MANKRISSKAKINGEKVILIESWFGGTRVWEIRILIGQILTNRITIERIEQ